MVDGAGAILRRAAKELEDAITIIALKNQFANTKRPRVVNAALARINAGIIAVIK
jgi:hypothetical protein